MQCQQIHSYIKEIEMYGFKSYTKRTVLTSLDPHINVLTGLNASGKTGILQAIYFALGIDLSTLDSYPSSPYSESDETYKQQWEDFLHPKENEIFVSLKLHNGSEEDTIICRKMTKSTSGGGYRDNYTLNGNAVNRSKLSESLESFNIIINNQNITIPDYKIPRIVAMDRMQIKDLFQEFGESVINIKKEEAKTIEENLMETRMSEREYTLIKNENNRRGSYKEIKKEYETLMKRKKIYEIIKLPHMGDHNLFIADGKGTVYDFSNYDEDQALQRICELEEEMEYIEAYGQEELIPFSHNPQNDMEKINNHKIIALTLAYELVKPTFESICDTLMPSTEAKLDMGICNGVTLFWGNSAPRTLVLDDEHSIVYMAYYGLWITTLQRGMRLSWNGLGRREKAKIGFALLMALLKCIKPAPFYLIDTLDLYFIYLQPENEWSIRLKEMMNVHFPRSQFIIASADHKMNGGANVMFATKFCSTQNSSIVRRITPI